MCRQALAGPENIKECFFCKLRGDQTKQGFFFGGISHATDNEGQFDGLHGLLEVTSVTLLM